MCLITWVSIHIKKSSINEGNDDVSSIIINEKTAESQHHMVLVISSRAHFWVLEKTPVILLNWFAAHQQTSTFRHQKICFILLKLLFSWLNLVPASQKNRKWLERKANSHCTKNVQIRSIFGPCSVQTRENTDQKKSVFGHFWLRVKN